MDFHNCTTLNLSKAAGLAFKAEGGGAELESENTPPPPKKKASSLKV